MNIFELANEYKKICCFAADLNTDDLGKFFLNSYKFLEYKHDKKSNFKGLLFSKSGNYVICFVGTNFFSIKDHCANFKMATCGVSRQMRCAVIFTKYMLKKYKLKKTCLNVIGHSEGGTEATYVGMRFHLKTVTFNAFGIDKDLVADAFDSDGLIINFRDPHDPISKIKPNIGITYIVPKLNQKLPKTPLGWVKAHKIANMGDCRKSVLVKSNE